ncbi:MAG: hypothetical protein R3C19_12905 [Planctomycetaceae bacterium]
MSKRPYNQADDFADRDMTVRHSAAESESASSRRRDFSNNAEALAASMGFSTGGSDCSGATFGEIQRVRKDVAARIESCRLLDERLRSDLAFRLRLVDTTSGSGSSLGPTSVHDIASEFRSVVAKSHPEKDVNAVLENELELKWIAEDLNELARLLQVLRSSSRRS